MPRRRSEEDEHCDNLHSSWGGSIGWFGVFPPYRSPSHRATTLDAELRLIGPAQVASAERLNTQPAAAKVKAQALDDFDKALAAFKLAVDARQAGDTKVSQARATKSGARERFVRLYDSNMGAIRQLFPRDRAQQDLHFDEIAT